MEQQAIISTLRRAFIQVDVRRRLQIIALALVLAISGLLEFISISLIIPFLTTLSAPSLSSPTGSYPFIDYLLRYIGFDTSEYILPALTLIFCTSVLLSSLFRLFTLWLNCRISGLIASDFSIKAFTRVIQSNLEFHQQSSSSNLKTTLTTDIFRLTYEVINPALLMFSSLVLILFLMISLMVITPSVTIALFAGLAGFYSLTILFTKGSLKSLSRQQHHLNRRHLNTIQNSLASIRMVILSCSQFRIIRDYSRDDSDLRRAGADSNFISFYPNLLLEPAGIILLAVCGFAIHKTSDIQSALPTLGALALGAQKLLPLGQRVYSGWSQITGASTSLVNILSLMELQPNKYLIKSISEYQPDIQSTQQYQFHTLSLQNISYGYSKTRGFVLNNLSLTIHRGDRIGIIGTTGSGKSTLLDLITGLLRPNKGVVLVNGEDIHNTKTNSSNLIRHYNSISLVPQDIYLSNSTVLENIVQKQNLNTYDQEWLNYVCEQAQILQFVHSLPDGFMSPVADSGKNLSGGQRQRIAIARALFQKKQILILDESTSALDSQTQELFTLSLANLPNHLTIISVAHRTSALSHCYNIIKL